MPFLAQKGVGQLAAEEPVAAAIAAAARMMPVKTQHDMTRVAAVAWHVRLQIDIAHTYRCPLYSQHPCS